MAEISIRKATYKDLEGIYTVMQNTGHAAFYGNKSFQEVRAELTAKLFKEGVTVLIALDGENIVGYSIFGPYLQYATKKNLALDVEINGKQVDIRAYACSLGTGVLETQRGQGIGLALRLAADSEAKHQGFKGMVTDVDFWNQPSKRNQYKAGFVQVTKILDRRRKSGINTLWVKTF
ncbi:GNAT family N-acetyltransferase [Candidatus Woesearchaeota archaeon]|nr:GNAT family N-acetyltransferase [Candidatus Woesearchaeota archaeon]